VSATGAEVVTPARPARSRRRWLTRASPFLVVLGVLGAWEAGVRLGSVPAYLLPPPSSIVYRIVADWRMLGMHAWVTTGEVLVGYVLAVIVSIPLAALLARFRPLENALYPLLVASQTVPKVAIAPLLVVWFGFGLLPKVLIVVLVTFFPITIALLDGFASTPAEASELMRSLGAGPGETFRKIRWPSGLPGLFTGLRISATYAVVAAVIGEYVGATDGLGIWMQLSQRSFRTDLVFAAIVLTAVLSIALYAAVVAAERATIPWWRAARATASVPISRGPAGR
jgi:NitT/TauT family transport system permease protein